jgi:hypothetical protein
VCDVFHCLPSEAEAELARAPVGWIEEVIEAGNYADMKALYDGATTDEAVKRLPDTPLMELVKAIDEELVLEQMHADDDTNG